MNDPHGVLEIKCQQQLKILRWRCRLTLLIFLYKDGNDFHLKNNNYYYQVQGQMHITQRTWCDFVIWTPQASEMVVERIAYDSQFWGECTLNSGHSILDPCYLNWLPIGFLHLSISETQYMIDTHYFNTHTYIHNTPYTHNTRLKRSPVSSLSLHSRRKTSSDHAGSSSANLSVNMISHSSLLKNIHADLFRFQNYPLSCY